MAARFPCRADGDSECTMPAPEGQQMASIGAMAQLVARGCTAPAVPGPCFEEVQQRAESTTAVAHELAAEGQRAAAELHRQAACQGRLVQELEEGCATAEQHHEAISAALAALAANLDRLTLGARCYGSGSGRLPPLLSLGVPDSYAAACSALLESLAGYVQHHFPDSSGGSGGLPVAQCHQQECRELEQLQSCLCKAERLRVEEEAEMTRLQAELEALRAPSTSASASLGYSAADLEVEVMSLQRRQAASLGVAQAAAEAAAAGAAGAEVVEGQCQQRKAGLAQRLQAKQQVAGMLARHLARQLLVRQLLQQEQAVVKQVLATVAAAREDAVAAMQAALERLPGYEQQQVEQQAAEQQQQEAESGPSLLATAEQLLACRAQLQQLAEHVHARILPAQHTVVTQLAGLLYGSDGQPQLTPPELQAQLAAVTAACEALKLQANAVLTEVIERQGAVEERKLTEEVLVRFWSQPEQLAAMAEKGRQRLERYA